MGLLIVVRTIDLETLASLGPIVRRAERTTPLALMVLSEQELQDQKLKKIGLMTSNGHVCVVLYLAYVSTVLENQV